MYRFFGLEGGIGEPFFAPDFFGVPRCLAIFGLLNKLELVESWRREEGGGETVCCLWLTSADDSVSFVFFAASFVDAEHTKLFCKEL